MRTIEQAGELAGRKVFLRADLDVPVLNGSIGEPFRIVRQKDNLHYLLDHGARVVMAAHISAIPSFEPIKGQLEELLEVRFGEEVTLLENTRQNPGEERNDRSFAQELVDDCDIYVDNAFAVCHRRHASVVAAAELLPSYAGLLVEQEIRALKQFIDAPAQGKVIFMGGAKASTKVPVINHLLPKAQTIAVGGLVANDILAGQTDVDMEEPKLRLPDDFIKDEKGQDLDIGPRSAERFAELAWQAKMIIWNGPMGVFEDEHFAHGTLVLAQAIAESRADKLIGGGDTIAAVDKLGLLDKMGFVSTGGGAMLTFLAGQPLPGLEVLGYHD